MGILKRKKKASVPAIILVVLIIFLLIFMFLMVFFGKNKNIGDILGKKVKFSYAQLLV